MAKRIVDEEMRFTVIINGNEAQKELFDLEKSTKGLTATNKQLRAERAKLQQQGKRNTVEYKNLTQEIKANSKTISANKTRMAALQKQIGITGLTMGQLRKKASMLRLQLNNMVPGSAQFKKLEAELNAVNLRLTQLRGNARATEGSLSKLAGGFNKFQAIAFATIAVLTGFVLSLQKVIDFNGKLADSMSDVRKTTGMNKKEVEDLAKSFGLLHTRTSRINLLKIAEEGGRIGIAKDEISDFVAIMDKAVVALGDSFPGGAEETASKLGKLKLLFKETKNQRVDKAYNAIGSAINELGANGVATEINIANFATRIGALPDALKPSIDAALALGAGFEESGIQAEIGARAYGIVIQQAALETGKFADVMGITKEAVADLINEDPVEFMIEFASGLEGMNATDTAETLDYLGVKAVGASKVLGALSNNTNKFRELMDLSNKSMTEGTSLIKEYNIKNNNLAGSLDKVGKRFKGYFTSKAVTNWLSGLVISFGKLIGAIKDVNKEFKKQSKLTFENAKHNRALADSSSELLAEYESLTRDGVEPTTASKKRLDEITLQLKDNLGESVFAIDKETGAWILNTDAVREQIKIKRLASDEEASTLVSRLKGTDEEKKRLQATIPNLEKEYKARQRLAKQAVEEFNKNPANKNKTKRGKLGAIARIPQVIAERDAWLKLNEVKGKINEQEQRRLDLLTKLKALNFTEADTKLLFGDGNSNSEGPQEGDTKQMGGATFIFKNGKWTIKNTFSPTKPPSSSTTKTDPTLDLLRKNLDLKNQLIQDDFEREMAILETNSKRKIEKLRSQIVDETGLKGVALAKAKFTNKAINDQILLEAQVFQDKQETLALKYIQKDLDNLTSKYDREAEIRRANFELELAQMDLSNQERKAKQDAFDKAELILRANHTQEVIDKVNDIINSGEFKGIDLEILTEEQKQQLVARLEELGLSLTEINKLLAIMQGKGEAGNTLDIAGELDVLGFSIQQWDDAFNNLDTIKGKLELAAMGVQAFGEAWAMYNEFASANEQKRLNEFEQNNKKQQTALKNRLDAGLINQRQYDAATKALENALQKRQAEAEYKQAKREKESAIASIILNTAVGVSKALKQGGFVLGVPWAAIVGGLGALQLALAIAQPLPAKGFEQGYGYDTFPVKREQDGKIFNSRFGGQPKSGMVNEPTILVGEMPELIITNPDLKKFNPEVTQSLANELARVRGFEQGFTGAAIPQPTTTASADNELLLNLVAQNTAVLQDLRDKGVIALLSRNMENTQLLKEDLDKLKIFRNKSAV